jgi:hypothetical protein
MFQLDRCKSVAVCVRWMKWMHNSGDNNLLFLSVFLCSLVLSPKLLKMFQLNLVFRVCTTTGVTGIRLFRNRLTVR